MTQEVHAENAPAKRHKAAAAETKEAIVLDLGKKDRKQVRKLARGKPGRLMNRVEEAIQHLRETGAIEAGTQPVIIVVRQRPKRRRNRMAKAWGLG